MQPNAENHLHLVYQVATNAKRPSQMAPEELYGAAWEGLAEAARKFDGRCRFSTYAEWIMRGRIADYLCSLDHVSRHMRRTGRVPTFVEIDETVAQSARNPFDRDTFAGLIRCLDRKDRLIMALRYVEGLTWNEIGQAVGLCPHAARQRHWRALDLLRRHLTTKSEVVKIPA